MTHLEDKILIRELGKLAGFFAGFGVRLAAKRLPNEEFEITVTVNAKINDVRATVSQILQSMGRLSNDFASQSMDDSISAIVGSGHMNLNPTIVHIKFGESQPSTRLSIKAIAKEGTVKQNSAEKAVDKIKKLLLAEYAGQVHEADF